MADSFFLNILEKEYIRSLGNRWAVHCRKIYSQRRGKQRKICQASECSFHTALALPLHNTFTNFHDNAIYQQAEASAEKFFVQNKTPLVRSSRTSGVVK
jgi:hypothetical protein